MTTNAAEIFARRAKEHPNRTALSSPSGDIDYGGLDRWSDAIAENLELYADAYNRPAVLIAEDRAAAISAIIGAMKAGVVFVPLDPEQPLPRLLSVIDVADPSRILFDAASAALVARLDLPPTIRQIPIGPPRSGATPRAAVDPEDADAPCYLYFTSGSTGEAKGILGRLKSVAHFARWEARAFALDETVRCSQLTTSAFDAILRDIFTPLCIGGTVCLPPDRWIVGDGARLAGWLETAAVTLLHTTPSILRVLGAAVRAGTPVPSRLARICVAGEALLSADVARFYEAFGEGVELVNFYGPSETTMIKLFHRVTPKDVERHAIPVGQPIDGARALVLDSRLKPCGIGMIGEIFIRTPFRSLGYYQRPDLTADAFIQNPMNSDPSDVIYRTGDLGRTLENGDLEFVGRRDRQVKINGVRVEIAEVENAFRENRAVRDVVVVEKPMPNGGLELAAYVVVSPEIPEAELRGFVADRLPSMMIPAHFLYVPILLRTVTGKIDFAALPDLLPQVPTIVQYVAPQTPVEQTLADIWSELMQIEAPSVNANFFSVGGHSLLAMQVLSRAEAAFAVSVALRDFLREPTVRGLATQIETEVLAASDDDELLQLLQEP